MAKYNNNYNYKSATKKLNKGALIGIFTAILMLTATIFGWLYFDTNKKYDNYKKDSALTLDKAQADKTTLQTQLESKQAELEELQANATANASQIAQLESEIQNLENQLENVEYINKTIDDLVIEYSNERLILSAQSEERFMQLFIEPNYQYLGSDFNDFKEMECSSIDLYDRYLVFKDGDSNEFTFQKSARSGPSFILNLEYVNEDMQDINSETVYRIISYEYEFSFYTVDELSNLGFDITQEYIKEADVIVKFTSQL